MYNFVQKFIEKDNDNIHMFYLEISFNVYRHEKFI